MTTPPLKKSIGRSPSRLGLLLIPVVFACFALAQSAQAVGPEPNEGDLIGNMAEEADAVAELGSDTVEAAMGQAAENPNKRVLQIKDFEKFLQCAGGKVKLSFKVMVTFTQPRTGLVVRHSIKFLEFKGTAVAGGRELKATEKDLKFLPEKGSESFNEAQKEGQFGFEFEVTGPGLPASSPFQFVVKYQSNFYKWREGKVTGNVIWDKTPIVKCSN